MNQQSFQDWEPKVLYKNNKNQSSEQKKNTLITAQRKGETLSVKKDTHTDPNYLHILKIEKEQETFKHETVSLSLSKQIAKARNSAKLTQKELAQRLNLPQTTIQNYENGKSIPNKMIISKIKQFLKEHWG